MTSNQLHKFFSVLATLILVLIGTTGFGAATAKLTLSSSSTGGSAQIQIGGSWENEGEYTINTNTAYSIRATASTGYKFVRWRITSDDTTTTIANSTASSTTVTVTATSATSQTSGIYAVFATSTTKTLTLNAANPAAGGNPNINGLGGPGSYTIPTGTKYKVSANPAAGYTFTKWNTTGGAAVVCPSSETTYVSLTDDGTLEATYTAITTSNVSVTVNPTGKGCSVDFNGSALAETVTSTVNNNEWYNINAYAAVGYRFTGWKVTSGNGVIADSKNSSTKVYITDNTNIEADFEATSTATITMNADPQGTVRYWNGAAWQTSGTVSTREPIMVRATAPTGYTFENWTVSSGYATIADNENANTTVYLLGDATITANFVKTVTLTMAISTSGSSSGTTNPAAGTTTDIGEGVKYLITATPGAGSVFDKWEVTTGTATISADNAESTYVTLTTDATVTAYFKEDTSTTATGTLTVNVSPVDGGTTTSLIPGVHTLNQYQWYSINAVAEVGYHFTGWTTSGDVTIKDLADPTTQLYISGDGSSTQNTVTAYFEEDDETDYVCLTIAADPIYGGDELNYGIGNFTVSKGWHTVTASPSTGFTFTKWAVTSGSAVIEDLYTSTTQICLSENTTITAYFSQNSSATTYELLVDVRPLSGGGVGGSIVIGSNALESGIYYKVTATPNDEYRFSSWTASSTVTVEGASSSSTYIKLSGNGTLTANFTRLESVELTLNSSTGGQVKYGANAYVDNAVYTVPKGEWLDIYANPTTNFTFTGWSVSGNATVLDANASNTKVYMTGDATVTANFSTDYNPSATVYLTLASSPECGGTPKYYNPYIFTWEDGPGQFTVNTGSSVQISVSVTTGYRFTGWSYSGSAYIENPTSSTTKVYLYKDTTLTANFEKTATAALTVAVESEEKGSFFTNIDWTTYSPSHTFNVSTKQWYDISADAKPGYVFSQWEVTTGDATIQNIYLASTHVCVTGDATVTAKFSEASMVELTMAVNTDGAGETTPSVGTSTVTANEWVTINVTPATGYKFTGWTITNNAVLMYDASIDSNAVKLSGDATVTANFSAVTTARMTLASSPTEGGTEGNFGWGTFTVSTGTWIALDAAANTGYKFSKWSVTSGSASILDVNEAWTYVYLTGDATITATFTEDATDIATLTITADPSCAVDSFKFDGVTSYLGEHKVAQRTWYAIEVTANKMIYNTGKGYMFTGWEVTTGNAAIIYCSTGSTYKVYVTGNATITAKFIEVDTVKLTMAASPEDAGRVDPEGTNIVPKNQWYYLWAMPTAGYKFTKYTVSGDGVLVNEDVAEGGMVYLTGDATVTANFEEVTTAKLTIAVTPEGAGKTNYAVGTHTVSTGVRYELTAQPATGYVFSGWSIDQNGTLYRDECYKDVYNQVYVVLTGDATVTASFTAASTLTLTLASSPEGAGSLTPEAGSYTYTAGVKYKLKAQAVCDYEFSSWTVSDTVSIVTGDSSSETIYVTMSGDATITANFTAKPTAQLTLAASPAYALSGGSSGWQNTMEDSGSGKYFQVADSYSKCSTVTFESWLAGTHTVYKNKRYLIYVVPIESYKFKKWTISGDATITKVTDYGCWTHCSCSSCGSYCPDWYYLTLTGDATVTAEFEERGTATLSVDIDPDNTGIIGIYGTVTSSYEDINGSTTVYKGNSYLLKAYSAQGYYLQGWEVSSGDAVINYTFTNDCYSEICVTVNGDATIKASFGTKAPTIPTLTMAEVSAFSGTTTPTAGLYKLMYNKPYPIKASAASGYYFIRWTLSDETKAVLASAVSSSTNITLTGDVTLTPVFGKLVEDGLTVNNINIKTNNNNDSEKPKDSISIKKAKLQNLEDISGISSSNPLIIGVEGWKTSITAWTKAPKTGDKKQVYTYISDDKSVKVVIDTTKNTLDLTVKNVDIYSKIDPSDGIDVFIILGTTKYEDSVTVNQKTTWSYKAADKNDSIERFSATYTSVNGATVNKDVFSVIGKNLSTVSGFDTNSVVKVIFSNGASWTFDPSEDTVTVTNKGNKYTYKYKSADKTVDPSSRTLVIDFDKKWSFRVSKGSQGDSLSTDGTMVITLQFINSSGTVLSTQGFVIPTDSEDANPLIIKTTLYKKK